MGRRLARRQMGFYDFAGSTLVHSVGGWAGLAAIIVLGARKGKYGADGGVRPILPSNLPLATIGVFLLWFGWFGFNGGSVLAASPASRLTLSPPLRLLLPWRFDCWRLLVDLR